VSMGVARKKRPLKVTAAPKAAQQLGMRADWRRWKTWCASQEPARRVFPAAVDGVIRFGLACSPAVEVDERGVSQMVERPPAAEVWRGPRKRKHDVVRHAMPSA
jgi:hypothetical protein